MTLDDTRADATADAGRRPDEALTRGELLGRYVILERLGAGAMGIVYAAYDPELDRRIAIKVLHPAIWGPMQSSGRQRLLREARALAKLAHPHVITVHDVGTHDDHLFVAMEFVEGVTLTEWMAKQDRTWAEVLAMYQAAGRGLAAAHAVGLVHRDFKPDNVMVGNDGRVRVLDFGLARAVAEDAPSQPSLPVAPAGSESESDLSRSGSSVGTPAYMAPEQHFGLGAEAPADQFSFCVALWEGLHGERPFAGDTWAALAFNVTEGRMRQVRESPVPSWLREVLSRGLAVDADARWPSMDELLEQLGRDPSVARRRWIFRGAFAVAIGLAGWGVTRGTGARDSVCTGTEAKLAGVWDDVRRNEVEASLLATQAAFADDQAIRVRSMLDAYATSWIAAHVDACEATNVRREQSGEMLDLRMGCLAQRRNELAALVDVLAHADLGVLEQAVRAVNGLGSLDSCGDPVWLAARVKPPDDTELAARVENLEAQLAMPQALLGAGQFAAAAEAVAPLLAEARELEYPPIHASAALLHASIAQRAGSHADAEAAFLESIEAAEAGSDDLSRARAWTLLVGLFGYNRSSPGQAVHAAQVATGVVARLGNQPDHVAALETTKGIAAYVGGRHEEALESLERARGIRRRLSGPNSLDVAIVQSNMVAVLIALYRHTQAAELASGNVSIYEETVGSRHPFTARALTAQATVHRAMGDNENARRELEQAVTLTEAALGWRHPDLAIAFHNLGSVNVELGRYQDAEVVYQRAIAIKERTYPGAHPSLAVTLSNFGDLLVRQERAPESLPYLMRALAMYEAALGPSHRSVADALTGLVGAQLGIGSPGRAIEYARRALELREATPGDPADVAEAKFLLARALWAGSRERAKARDLAEQAQAAYRELGDRGKQQLEEIGQWLAAHEP